MCRMCFSLKFCLILIFKNNNNKKKNKTFRILATLLDNVSEEENWDSLTWRGPGDLLCKQAEVRAASKDSQQTESGAGPPKTA